MCDIKLLCSAHSSYSVQSRAPYTPKSLCAHICITHLYLLNCLFYVCLFEKSLHLRVTLTATSMRENIVTVFLDLASQRLIVGIVIYFFTPDNWKDSAQNIFWFLHVEVLKYRLDSCGKEPLHSVHFYQNLVIPFYTEKLFLQKKPNKSFLLFHFLEKAFSLREFEIRIRNDAD